jgi:hypothetical protein
MKEKNALQDMASKELICVIVFGVGSGGFEESLEGGDEAGCGEEECENEAATVWEDLK